MAQDNIEGLKRRLESAQQERKNKAEYDELAKRILKIPERTENERLVFVGYGSNQWCSWPY